MTAAGAAAAVLAVAVAAPGTSAGAAVKHAKGASIGRAGDRPDGDVVGGRLDEQALQLAGVSERVRSADGLRHLGTEQVG